MSDMKRLMHWSPVHRILVAQDDVSSVAMYCLNTAVDVIISLVGALNNLLVCTATLGVCESARQIASLGLALQERRSRLALALRERRSRLALALRERRSV